MPILVANPIYCYIRGRAVVLTPDTIYAKVKLEKAKHIINGTNGEAEVMKWLNPDKTIAISSVTRILADKRTGVIELRINANTKVDGTPISSSALSTPLNDHSNVAVNNTSVTIIVNRSF